MERRLDLRIPSSLEYIITMKSIKLIEAFLCSPRTTFLAPSGIALSFWHLSDLFYPTTTLQEPSLTIGAPDSYNWYHISSGSKSMPSTKHRNCAKIGKQCDVKCTGDVQNWPQKDIVPLTIHILLLTVSPRLQMAFDNIKRKTRAGRVV